MIQFLDLKFPHVELAGELDEAIKRVVNSGWYILGPEVESFEQEFANFCGAKFAVGVANGLEALHLTLRSMGIGPGDEVIVPSNTYIATWLAVSQCGAIPVPVEPDELTFNIDPTKIEAAITRKTKAVLPVHLYGQSADVLAITSICDAHSLHILWDAAQAHGAKFLSQTVGGERDAVAWSFYPGKNLGALGDGGAVTTNDEGIAARLRVLRNYGSKKKYHNEVPGYNSRLDELQAAILRVKLKHLNRWNSARNRIAQKYSNALRLLAGLTVPSVPDWSEPVWHLYVIRHQQRDALQEHLSGRGVGTMIHYPIPPHLQPAYAPLGFSQGQFPISEAMHREVLSLPISPSLTDNEIDTVTSAIAEFYR